MIHYQVVIHLVVVGLIVVIPITIGLQHGLVFTVVVSLGPSPFCLSLLHCPLSFVLCPLPFALCPFPTCVMPSHHVTWHRMAWSRSLWMGELQTLRNLDEMTAKVRKPICFSVTSVAVFFRGEEGREGKGRCLPLYGD